MFKVSATPIFTYRNRVWKTLCLFFLLPLFLRIETFSHPFWIDCCFQFGSYCSRCYTYVLNITVKTVFFASLFTNCPRFCLGSWTTKRGNRIALFQSDHYGPLFIVVLFLKENNKKNCPTTLYMEIWLLSLCFCFLFLWGLRREFRTIKKEKIKIKEIHLNFTFSSSFSR